jgi:uncharacterized OsmC-like protein
LGDAVPQAEDEGGDVDSPAPRAVAGSAALGAVAAYSRPMDDQDVRRSAVDARSTDTFGRVLCSARDHHFVVDGPVHNGCPGEELTPAELFLAGVAACGVELLQVLARGEDIPLGGVRSAISGEIDPNRPLREDVTVFNRVRLRFELKGVTAQQGDLLVKRFKGR